MLDVIIRGGILVDGTGAPPRRADLCIQGGRIVNIAPPDSIKDDARRTIDVDGLMVTPGFVDLHTHLDAQVFWDSACSPLPLYGITTAISGNCGFSLAPAGDDDREYLTRLLAHVEEMPLETLEAAVPWNWHSTAEFLARVESCGPAINLGFMVGHSAIRRMAMGERSISAHASVADIERMKDLLRESLAGGGIGFSTSWYSGDVDGDGSPVPSRFADAEEIVALCSVAGEFPGTQIAFAPDLRNQRFFGEAEIDLFTRMSLAANRPVNWNPFLLSTSNREIVANQLSASDAVARAGGLLVALGYPAVIRQRREFFGHWYTELPGWPVDLSRAEKVALLRDPKQRTQLDIASRAAHGAGADRHNITQWDALTIFETFSPETRQFEGRTVGAIAIEEGRAPFDVLCDLAIADGMRTVVSPPAKADDEESWAIRIESWRDPRVVSSVSDAGAHTQSLSTFDWATEFLRENRKRQVLPIEQAIRKLTQIPAALYGLRDRGQLLEGSFADILIFDPETLAPGRVAWTQDLPAGAGRISGTAIGLQNVFVNGIEIVSDGVMTENRGGRVIRSGIDTFTVEPVRSQP